MDRYTVDRLREQENAAKAVWDWHENKARALRIQLEQIEKGRVESEAAYARKVTERELAEMPRIEG